MTAENRKKSENKGSPYSRFKKKLSRDLKQKCSMYNNKLQKPAEKSRAVRAKTCFIWESWRVECSNLHGHTSKFWEKVSESGKAEGPTYIKLCMGLHEKTKDHKI